MVNNCTSLAPSLVPPYQAANQPDWVGVNVAPCTLAWWPLASGFLLNTGSVDRAVCEGEAPSELMVFDSVGTNWFFAARPVAAWLINSKL